MSSKARRDVWNLLDVKDERGDSQFGVQLNGEDKTVELFYVDYKGDLARVVFKKKKMRKVSRIPLYSGEHFTLYFVPWLICVEQKCKVDPRFQIK